MTISTELRTLSRLSAPPALTQVGLMMTGVVDTVMVGRLGVLELAASALANMWQWTWLAFGLGVVTGIDPMISQAHGRGDGPGAALALQRGVVVALLVSVPVCVLQAATGPGLLLLGQDPAVSALAHRYNLLKLPTVPCFLVYSALRQYLQGRTLMAPPTWVMWIGNAVHVVGNWLLIFGEMGAPALGLDGAAIASSVTTVFLAGGLALWIRVLRLHDGAWRPWDATSFSPAGLARVTRLGVPIGLQMTLEASAFTLATFMAGWIDPVALGGHHVVLNMAALAFMVPLGISQGASARVGNLIGQRDVVGMRRALGVSLVLGAGVMTLSAATFVTLRHELPVLYTSDAGIRTVAATLLPYAAAFQIFDGTQVVAGGLLRGMGRPDAAAGANLVGYFVVGLPLAYFLGFTHGGGVAGIWAGLVIGLVSVATMLVLWVRHTARRSLDELTVEKPS